jgi:hypothetical protein
VEPSFWNLAQPPTLSGSSVVVSPKDGILQALNYDVQAGMKTAWQYKCESFLLAPALIRKIKLKNDQEFVFQGMESGGVS